jgi:hypothetical protein
VQDINERGGISQKWTIEAAGHRKNHVSFDFADFMEIKDDHPLLWEFTDTQCQLYFTRQCKDPAKLFFDLYATHKRLFGNINGSTFLSAKRHPISNRFNIANGLLTQGSKKLMEKYAECLKQNGLDFSIISERPAKYWDGEQFNEEDTNLKVLFFGNTYVIAKDFSFVQQDENSR